MANAFFSTNTGIGLSLLRNRVAPDGSAAANEIGLMMKAQALGAKVWSTPWSPPAAFKNSGSVNGGNYKGGMATNQAYADQLAAYVLNMKTNYGINIYAISVQNEPNVNTTNYESCVWTATKIHNFVPYLYEALSNDGVSTTKIMIPEDSNWQSTNLYTTTLDDSNTAAEVGIIANHNYLTNNVVGDQTAPAVLPAYGKALWETEVSTLSDTPDGSITNAVYWAGRIHLFLTVPQVNAWHYWWLISYDDNAGLEIQGGIPTKRMYVLGQYSRFVRPGYYRIDVTNDTSLTLISAYNDTNSGNFAVVAINPTSSVVTQMFNLKNFPAVSPVTPWITSASLSLASQSAVTVANGSFTYPLPATSVVTFVGHRLLPYSIQLAIPASATEGDGVLAGQGSITLTTTSSNDLTINLTSSNTNKVTVPSGVVIPAGQSNAVFDLTIVNDLLLDGDQSVVIAATATNYSPSQATIRVHSTNTASLNVTLPATAAKNAGTLVNAGLVSVSSAVAMDYPVSLASSDPTKLTVPATVIIPTSQTSAVFNLNIVDDDIIDGPQNVSVTASVPNWTSGSNSMTILDDNPLPDHFTWSAIPSPQWVGGPIPVTITALDASNNVVDFRLPVTLSAFITRSVVGTNTLLNSPATDQSATDPSNYPDYTLGYSFTMNTNAYVTHVRSYFGDKVSIWNDSGQILATQAVVSVPGTWVDTPLSSPVFLSAGATYLVAVHEYQAEYFWSESLPNTFANGTIHETLWDSGDVFPQTADRFTQWYYVDVRYGTDLSPASINPTVAANFTNGAWSGSVAVLQAGTNVMLQASAGLGSAGTSGAFSVLATPKLAITALSNNAVVLSWPASAPGFDLVQSATMSNWTSNSVTPAIVSNYNVVTNIPTQTSTFYRLYKPVP